MEKHRSNYAFIDSQNLNLSVQAMGWTLDFKRFFIYLKDKYKIEKAFLFIGYVAENEALYTTLQKAGYVIIFKPTLEYKKDGEKYTKGNVDAELVLHTMIQYPNYDKAMIVSGDGDFHCLIEYLQQKGKLSHVVIPNPKRYSALLRKFHRYFVYVDRLRQKLEKSGGKGPKKRGSNLRTRP